MNGLLAVVLCFSGAGALAATPPSVSSRVERAAREHLLAYARQAGLSDPSVDVTLLPRGTPSACSQEIDIEAVDTRHVARMRFAAVCKAEPAWRTEFVVRGAIKAAVVVAAADLEANRPIDPERVTLARRDVANASDAFTAPTQVAGKTPRRAIRSGQVVSKRLLVEPILVKRGARVNVIARKVGVEVHVAADAMQTGHRDEVIEVRNIANGKILRARVTGENSLELVTDIPMSSTPQ
jgi:flagella basal body P-ring formation protein FlgA